MKFVVLVVALHVCFLGNLLNSVVFSSTKKTALNFGNMRDRRCIIHCTYDMCKKRTFIFSRRKNECCYSKLLPMRIDQGEILRKIISFLRISRLDQFF